MKQLKIYLTATTLVLTMAGQQSEAQNPVVQTWFTADPAPLATDDRIYLYTGHDEDGADFYWMNEWRVYSSADMVNWTDHGSPLDLSSFEWADDRAWAAQAIERDGKYYWYICAHSKITNGMALGVAVADNPTGPFRDALGKPLYDNGAWDNIDPTVMTDDDGQAWLFWGNPDIHYTRLGRDMVSFEGEVQTINQTVEGFGAPGIKQRNKDTKYKDCYTEGPWIMRAPQPSHLSPLSSHLYYLLYAAGGIPEHISYSSAPSPEGPWTYRGEIMPHEDTGSFTNHCGIANFKGRHYFFYHTGKLPGGGGFGRSTAIEEFSYNADGTFPIIHHTDEGVKPIGTLNPYQRTEAETMAWSQGVKTEWNDETGVYVSEIHNGDYIKVREVDFGQYAPRKFTARVASALQGGTIEVRLDSLDGELIASIDVPHTGGWEVWKTLCTGITAPAIGKHDICFAFTGNKGAKLMTFDWWRFDMLSAPFGQTRIIEDGGTGPYKAIMTEVEGLAEHTLFFPQNLSAFDADRPLPILVWGNGACANSPFEHVKFLGEIASHGYLVVATGNIPMIDEWYKGPMSKPGQQIEAIDWAYTQNNDPQSPFYQKLDTGHICLSGMSCGGLQSLFNCADPRISALMICNSGLFNEQNAATAMPDMPMPPKQKLEDIHTPVIYILGGVPDIAYENGMDDFHRINHVPAIAANLPVGHGGTYAQPHGGEFAIVARTWLDWQLKADPKAAKMFTGKRPGLKKRKGWTIEKNKLSE